MREKKTTFLNFKHTRGDAQQKQMEQIAQDGVCPFCREHFEKYHNSPIEEEGEWWVVTKNDYPYDGTSAHYLLVYKLHATNVTEVDQEAWVEFGRFVSMLNEKHAPNGGAVFMRFGDMDYTGSSVAHLHAQFLVGGPHSEDAEKLRVKLGYKKR
ncbi:MAG: hypothetical protein OQJ98_02580 [Candidatus Pacebacteria bacterium]|nr:hypothetical protein [Candidatus Paceibacterota bacterium]